MLEELRHQVLEANLALPAAGLVILTSGNASGIDHDSRLVVIKPSGVPYDELSADDLVVVDIDGRVVEGERRPSTDTPTHLAIYRQFPQLGGIVHAHSPWASAWAQAERDIPVLGTTHADFSPHPVPVTRTLGEAEIAEDYELATGVVLAEAVGDRGPDEVPAALVRGHAPFCWGKDAIAALENAMILEQVAQIALLTTVLAPGAGPLPDAILSKHFGRKHGPSAYYGQR